MDRSALLPLLFDQNPQPIWIVEMDSMRFVDANPATEEIYGYPRAELLQRTIYDDLCESDRELLRSKRDALRTEPSSGVWQIRRKDGGLRWIEVRTQVIPDAPTPRRLVVGRDVTRERETAEELRDIRHRFESLRDSGTVGVMITQPDGRVLEANSALLDLLGFTPADVEAGRLNWIDQTPVEWRARSQKLVDDVHLEARPGVLEKEYLHRDGHRVQVLVATVPLQPERDARWMTIVVDLTMQRQAEQELDRTQTFFRALIENSPDAVSLFAADTTILYISPANAEISGVPVEQMVGKRMLDMPFMKDREAYLREWERCLAEPGVPQRVRLEVGGRHGTRYCESIRVNLLDDPRLRAVMTILRDRTEQRVLEDQLRQAQKMDAIGKLAGGVAHDFNNLLTVILQYGTLLAETLDAGAEGREDVNEIVHAAERARTLTKQLLAFSRRQVMSPRVLDMREVLRDAERLVRRLIGEHIELHSSLAETPLVVHADPTQLAQVLMNLAVNARDAMPAGGRLTLSGELVQLEAGDAARLAGGRPGRFARVRVEDTGVGMSSEVAARAFEPFYTTKGESGTGLGLSTVFGIVQQSGGFVTIDSEVGRGTRIDVYVPTSDGRVLPRARSEGHVPSSGQEYVLIVEDDEAVLNAVASSLRRHGYRVTACNSPEHALAHCSDPSQPIDMLITDLVMPRMNGRVLAAQVTALRPGVVVLYMSGYSEDDEVQREVNAGRARFVEKPVRAAELVRHIRDALSLAPRA